MDKSWELKKEKYISKTDDYVPLLKNENISGKPIYISGQRCDCLSSILTDIGNDYMHHFYNNNYSTEYYDTGIKDVIQIDSSYNIHAALTKDSKIILWGTSYTFNLDDYTTIDDFKNIKKISCGHEHFMIGRWASL